MKTHAVLIACTLLVNSSVALGQPEQSPAPAPEAAAAAEPAATGHTGTPEFGESGVIAVEAATGLEVSSTSTKAAQGEDPESVLKLRVEPSFHYFVATNLSVGALIAYDLEKAGDDKLQEIAFGPLVGYNLPVAEHLSLWPKVGGAYVLVSEELAGVHGSGNAVVALAEVPLLVHLAPHFHFGVGPFVRMDLVSKLEGEDADKRTTVGLLGSIGGWL